MAQEAQWRIQEYMLQEVAEAMGPDLLAQTAFVGGCTTALLVTDARVRDEARATDDVDVMIHVLGMAGWYGMQDELRARGFRQSADDDVICRMRLPRPGQSSLIVDFMPDDEAILGFGNRWYAQALASAIAYCLPNGAYIRVVAPPFFMATKLEAWKGRGRNDLLASRDIDDLFALILGRQELASEVQQAAAPLREFIAAEVRALTRHPDYGHAVQSLAAGSSSRESLFSARVRALTELGN